MSVNNQNQGQRRTASARNWFSSLSWITQLIIAVGTLAAAVVGIVQLIQLGGDWIEQSNGLNYTVAYQDDFSGTSSGWPEDRETDSGYLYDNDTYRIYLHKTELRQPVLKEDLGDFGDVEVEADVTVSDGQPDNAAAGIICRAQDYENSYYMGVYRNGYAYISKEISDEAEPLAQGSRGNIIGGTLPTTFQIRGTCVGSELTLYVNNEKVIEAANSKFKSGKVGLYVYNYDERPPGVDIRFDNFVVRTP